MSLKKSKQPRLTADGPKLGQGKSFPKLDRKAAKPERFTTSDQITELRQKLADLEQRILAVEKKHS